MVSELALGAIWGYQRFLSPRKGFRCAYSVLHGGTGCSGFAKYAIRDHGFWGAIPEIRQRFRDCRDASRTLRANCAVHSNLPGDDPHPRRRANRRRKAEAARKDKGDGCLGYGCDGLDCAGSACALPAFCAAGSASSQTTDGAGGGCFGDCSGPDCGGCDCAPSCG